MKIKFGLVVLVLAFLGWMVWSVVTGISGLTKTETEELTRYSKEGALCEFEVNYAKEVHTLKHVIFRFIPLGTDHFYLVFTQDSVEPLLVKASPSWYDENFNSLGLARGAVTIHGEVREFYSQSKKSIRELNSKLAELGESVSDENYVDSDYRVTYILRLLTAALLLSTAVVAVVTFMRVGQISKVAASAATIYMVVAVLASIGMNLY
ncbi:MAG: hypothetical protein K2N06_03065 [Oscillospiraceae bacterium]|nr:hypothetical protein [Oscillospiraceae bacterium]